MKRYQLGFIVSILMLLCSCTSLDVVITPEEGSKKEQNTYEKIIDRVLEQQMVVAADSVIEVALSRMSDDGSYYDIDYSSTARSGWQPNNHYYRLFNLAIAYINPESKWNKSSIVHSKIVKGLQYWYDTHPKSENWWYSWIEEPQTLGLILMAMRVGEEGVPKELEYSIIMRWIEEGGDPADEISSNRVNMALHWLYLACLTEDAERLKTALDYIWEQIQYVSGEGFKEDGSYQQHGKQLYIGSYAESNMEGLLQVALSVNGTEYELTGEKKEIFTRFVKGIYTEVIRGNSMHWNCMGRAMAYEGFIRNPEKRASYFNRMAMVDPDNAEEYRTTAKRIMGEKKPWDGVRTTHQHYFLSDYTTHVRQKFSASVRLVSNRTCRNENGNGENIFTYFLSDGATCITTNGDEYADLMPLWDWNVIPGTTAPLMESIPITGQWGVRGTTDLAGGVSDTQYGCTAYKYYDTFSGVDTGASKGWFFFDDEIICLGAGIKSSHEVKTCINQSWGGQEVTVSKGLNILSYGATREMMPLEERDWILHNDIGYYFPQKQIVEFSNTVKTGRWHDIAVSQREDELTGKVFTLTIPHTNMVHSEQGDSYSYVIIPGTDASGMTEYVKNCKIEILANTDTVQSVKHRVLNIIQAIFFEEGTLRIGEKSIYVNHPCCLLMRTTNGQTTVSVADPTQAQEGIDISFFDHGIENKYSVDFTGVGAVQAGSTKTFVIKEVFE